MKRITATLDINGSDLKTRICGNFDTTLWAKWPGPVPYCSM